VTVEVVAAWWDYSPGEPPPASGAVRLGGATPDWSAATTVALHSSAFGDAGGLDVVDVTAQLTTVAPGDVVDLLGAAFAVTGPPVIDPGPVFTFPVSWVAGTTGGVGGLSELTIRRAGPAPPTWATLGDLKIFLGIDVDDTESDDLLGQVLDGANDWAVTARRRTGRYPTDTPAVAPNPSVVLGVVEYCAIQLRNRGFVAARTAGGGLDGYDVPTMAAVSALLGLGSIVVA